MKNNIIISSLCNEILDARTQDSSVFAYYRALRQAEMFKFDIKEVIKLTKAYLEKQIELVRKGKNVTYKRLNKKELEPIFQ